jgi:hypothetical protein
VTPRQEAIIADAKPKLVAARNALRDLSLLVDLGGASLSDEMWTIIHELRDQVHELDD